MSGLHAQKFCQTVVNNRRYQEPALLRPRLPEALYVRPKEASQ
jgi:hypothetical protein